ncbi:hypothetical protein BDR03DRAFT_1096286 [Suillus americanus]|nr:hypothetical protein BDR03DRAFT_1096286 [Suillus americanus]
MSTSPPSNGKSPVEERPKHAHRHTSHMDAEARAIANADAKLSNPLRGIPHDRLMMDKGVLVAQDSSCHDRLEIFSDEEKQILMEEVATNAHTMVVMSSLAAAVQGMDEAVINGAQIIYPTQFSMSVSSPIIEIREVHLAVLLGFATFATALPSPSIATQYNHCSTKDTKVLILANRMAELSITLTPLDFYKGIVQKTGGRFFPLSDVNSLLDLFTGSILETADIDTQVVKHTNQVCTQAEEQNATTDDISKSLYGRLSSSAQINTFTVEDIYTPSEQGDKNVQIWFNAEQIDDDTKSQVKKVSLPISIGPARHDS